MEGGNYHYVHESTSYAAPRPRRNPLPYVTTGTFGCFSLVLGFFLLAALALAITAFFFPKAGTNTFQSQIDSLSNDISALDQFAANISDTVCSTNCTDFTFIVGTLQATAVETGTLEVDSIDALTAGPIAIGGTQATQVEFDDNIVLNDVDILLLTDEGGAIGSLTEAFTGVFSHQFVIVGKADYSQLTSITTAVPITGGESAFQITTQTAATATTASDSFDITNTAILASSYIVVQMVSYSGVPLTDGVPVWTIDVTGAGAATVTVSNYGANALDGTFVLRFIVL